MPSVIYLGYISDGSLDGASVASLNRATSFTTVNVEQTFQGKKSVEYFLASDAR